MSSKEKGPTSFHERGTLAHPIACQAEGGLAALVRAAGDAVELLDIAPRSERGRIRHRLCERTRADVRDELRVENGNALRQLANRDARVAPGNGFEAAVTERVVGTNLERGKLDGLRGVCRRRERAVAWRRLRRPWGVWVTREDEGGGFLVLLHTQRAPHEELLQGFGRGKIAFHGRSLYPPHDLGGIDDLRAGLGRKLAQCPICGPGGNIKGLLLCGGSERDACEGEREHSYEAGDEHGVGHTG